MIYMVHSVIIFLGSWVSDFAVNLREQKLIKAKTKQARLVLDDAVHKVNNKCPKQIKTSSLWCTFLHHYLRNFNFPTTPITHSKTQWALYMYKLFNVDRKMCTTIFQFF